MIPGYSHSFRSPVKHHQCLPVRKVSPVHQMDIILKARYWAPISLPGKGGKQRVLIYFLLLGYIHRCLLSFAKPCRGYWKKSHRFFFPSEACRREGEWRGLCNTPCCCLSPLGAHRTCLLHKIDSQTGIWKHPFWLWHDFNSWGYHAS